MTIKPDLLADHDVSGGTHIRTLTVLLAAGDSLTSSAVTFVDPTTRELVTAGVPDVFGDAACTTSTLTYGLISSSTSGDLLGVNLYLQNGTADQVLTLQWRFRTASQPSVDQYDEYYRVRTVA